MRYYVFGQDMRKVGAQIALHALPDDWYTMQGPVPVMLHDPEAEGDIAPESGADTMGDIIGGGLSLYSARLCDALEAFGIKLTYKPVTLFKPNSTTPVAGYNIVLGVSDVDCLDAATAEDELEYFEIDSEQTRGLSLFDVEHTLRIIDEALKLHLDAVGLEGVFMIPTAEYGGLLAHHVRWG